MQTNFFGSKLNSVLLLILIILLGFALRFMYKEKATYLPFMEGENKVEEVENQDNVNEVKSELKTISREKYSFQIPKEWTESSLLNVKGCIWDGASNDTNDGHRQAGEIGIYPKSCFDLSKSNGKREVKEKDGYYIVAYYDKETGTTAAEEAETKLVFQKIVDTFQLKSTTATTYIYANHGFTIELPKGFVVKEEQAATGPAIMISLPTGSLSYVTDASFWEKNSLASYKYIKSQKLGDHTFKIYTNSGATYYWFKQGNVGYQFGGTDTVSLEKIITTFKFVGWPQIQGNSEDLISFSILPNSEVKGVISYRGEIKGGYFFEGNILIAVTDINKKVIKQSNAMSTTDWMTDGPVKFEGNMDFSNLPKGKAYLKIQQDDPSGGESGKAIKEIFIPIIIK